MTLQRPCHQSPSHRDRPIRWSYLIERVLDQWDWTARLAVLALVATTCVTVMLGVLLGMASQALGALSAGAVVLAVADWSARRSAVSAA